MATTIEDGSGKGYSVKVDSENRFFTRSITESEFDKATRSGNAYNINTLFLPLSGGTETPILYLRNNEDNILNLAAWFIGTDNSTGTPSRQGLVKLYSNPTAGTIITSGADVTPANRLVGSSNVLDVDIKSGGDGFTVSGFAVDPLLYQTQGQTARVFGNIQLAILKGGSVVITYTPNGQNPLEIYAGFQVYLSDNNNL